MKNIFTFLWVLLFACPSFAQIWVPTNNFITPRNSQTANLLEDGRVIQIGGDMGFNAYSAAVEIYDLESNSWTLVDSLPYNVRMHSSFVLENNKVIVIGGTSNGSSIDGVLEYDIEANSWTTKTSMPKSLESLSAQKIDDTHIFVCGGWVFETGSVNSETYLYDTENDSWETVAPMPLGLVNSVCEMISNNEILIAGGVTASFSTSSSSYIYHIEENTWEEVQSLPFAISGGMSSVVLENGNVLAAGGFDFSSFNYRDKVLVFNVEDYEWTELATLNQTLSTINLVSLPDGTALLAGGTIGMKSETISEYSIAYFNGLIDNNSKDSSSEAFIVDVGNASLNPIENLPRAISGAICLLLDNNDVMISGGSGATMADETYNNAIIYNNPTTVGVENISLNTIEIYPNPCDGNLYINETNPSNSILSIYNTSGQCVLNQTISDVNMQINVSILKAGVYLITTDNKSYQKLIIK